MLVTFGAFTFDGAVRELRDGRQTIHLSPKAFELLGVLLRQRPNAISKAELHAALWPNTFVSDGSLAVLVAEIRRAIGDSGRRSSFVRTVNRFGYAFIGATAAPAAEPSPRGGPHNCSIVWNGERTRLKPGGNVIGRDPDADVCIDAIGVSRRHAMIVVATDVVTLSDLSSKNGTFVNGTRIVSPLALSDGAEISLGAVSLVFRRPRAALPTQTISHSRLRGTSS